MPEKSGHYSEVTQEGYPRTTAIILSTPMSADTSNLQREYRPALVRHELLKFGLRQKDDPHRINMEVASKAFGSAPVFTDRQQAIEATKPLTHKAHTGIKIYHINDVWPQAVAA